MEIGELFTKFLEEIEPQLSANAYNLWFSTLEPISLNENNIVMKVPMNIHKTTLSTTYSNIIKSTLLSLTGKEYEIEYLTEDELEEIKPKKEEKKVENNWDSNLNPDLTFDSFIVGDSNRLAVVSAHAVAENPGSMHNPFFLYGKSGIGKTHLMHAIGNYIVKHTDKKVLYVTSNEFVSDYAGIASVNKGNDSINYAQEFKNKYQNVDVLIVDDIQFLVGADKSQQEFFHTFNTLYNANKQIIISSDRSPDDLKKIEERLRSRFMMGLPVDIFPPDYELRVKIIKRIIKNKTPEIKINDDVIEYIANSCQNDVRHLEGTINRLMVYTAMMIPEKIDLKFATEALNDYISTNIYAENSISKIQKAVADYFEITVNDLKSKKRTNNVALPRHIAIYLCRLETNEGLARIGLEFGGRDHSTVSASCEKITNDLKEDDKLKQIVKDIKNKL